MYKRVEQFVIAFSVVNLKVNLTDKLFNGLS